MTPPQPPSRIEEYPHGYRLVPRTLPDGSVEWDRVALTVEDVLHPQEYDEIPVRGIHELDCNYLANIFRTRPLGPPVSYVTADWLTDWGVPELRNTSPDVAVFVGLQQQPDLERGTFSLPELGGRCLLAVEVVSPDRRVNDVVHKLREYHIVGIPLYVIIDQEQESGPRRVLAYRHTPARYEPIALNSKGRVYLEPLGLYLGMHDNRVACYEAATGKEMGDYVKLAQDLDAADRRIQEQEQVIEASVLQNREAWRAQRIAEERAREESKAREEAQRLAREETKAREEAQRLAREETKAREEAQRLAREESKTREEAQRQVRQEAKAREDAEQKVKELLATLQKLQGGTTE
jgi:Uma2 family endonuclease